MSSCPKNFPLGGRTGTKEPEEEEEPKKASVKTMDVDAFLDGGFEDIATASGSEEEEEEEGSSAEESSEGLGAGRRLQDHPSNYANPRARQHFTTRTAFTLKPADGIQISHLFSCLHLTCLHLTKRARTFKFSSLGRGIAYACIRLLRFNGVCCFFHGPLFPFASADPRGWAHTHMHF